MEKFYIPQPERIAEVVKVKVGDLIEIGFPIVEVESEKASTTLEFEKSGLVCEVLVKNGDIIKQGTIVCKIKEK